jgi:hypothetical protein
MDKSMIAFTAIVGGTILILAGLILFTARNIANYNAKKEQTMWSQCIARHEPSECRLAISSKEW